MSKENTVESSQYNTGTYIRFLRYRLGLKQIEVAQLIGWDPTALSGVETGRRKITLKSINILAKALSLSTEEYKTLCLKAGYVPGGQYHTPAPDSNGDFEYSDKVAKNSAALVEDTLRAMNWLFTPTGAQLNDQSKMKAQAVLGMLPGTITKLGEALYDIQNIQNIVESRTITEIKDEQSPSLSDAQYLENLTYSLGVESFE